MYHANYAYLRHWHVKTFFINIFFMVYYADWYIPYLYSAHFSKSNSIQDVFVIICFRFNTSRSNVECTCTRVIFTFNIAMRVGIGIRQKADVDDVFVMLKVHPPCVELSLPIRWVWVQYWIFSAILEVHQPCIRLFSNWVSLDTIMKLLPPCWIRYSRPWILSSPLPFVL
jgi:hypothetical protein